MNTLTHSYSALTNRVLKMIAGSTLALVALAQNALGAAEIDPAWSEDPVIASEDCADLSYPKAIKFLEKYYYPLLDYSDESKEAGVEMMGTYLIAESLISRSQICLAEALELKSLKADLQKRQQILTSGTSMSRKEMKKQRKLSAKANKAITRTANKTDELTPKQRKVFTAGSATFLAGTYATSRLKDAIAAYAAESGEDIQKAAEVDRSKGILGLVNKENVKTVTSLFGKANTVSTLTSGLKEHIPNLFKTGKFLVRYAEQQKLDLPPDATQQLSSVVGWE
ncbi:hypothetical protein HBA55_11520 [Pseudomaricurvus alkylphenolicus]|uniref:hypothetical protein n=1 Tax=Pseudomaricurvus alkylphenolicus TaxID=1306991 RepID=UPI0014246DA9|nr:hypothetical protein [Pseudomaricurvus alkylphenolicus]NIB40219.1 hypothetical protein [Pseudomaricurvus alkylphenolicus]